MDRRRGLRSRKRRGDPHSAGIGATMPTAGWRDASPALAIERQDVAPGQCVSARFPARHEIVSIVSAATLDLDKPHPQEKYRILRSCAGGRRRRRKRNAPDLRPEPPGRYPRGLLQARASMSSSPAIVPLCGSPSPVAGSPRDDPATRRAPAVRDAARQPGWTSPR